MSTGSVSSSEGSAEGSTPATSPSSMVATNALTNTDDATSGGTDASSSSTGWEPTNCDPSCQLPPLEEQWSFRGADALGPPPRSGRDHFFTALDTGLRTWIATEQVIPEGSALVRIDAGGRAQLSTAASLSIPEGAEIGIPFTGASESLIVYYSEGPDSEDPVVIGLVKLDKGGEVICTHSSLPEIWTEAKQTDTGDWALLGFDIGGEPARPAFVGDPCDASAEVYLSLPGLGVVDFDYFDERFVVTVAGNGESSILTFDAEGTELATWSTNSAVDPRIGPVLWAGRTPDGRMLLTDAWGGGVDGTAIVLAYVDLDTGDASIHEYPGLWDLIDPPLVVVDFDAGDVPWMIFGRRDLRISPLPTEGGEPCCPTITKMWVPDGLHSTWAFYPVPDGLIAATSAVPEDGGPEDIVVSRFRFVR